MSDRSGGARTRVVILGAGIVGLASAVRLLCEGHEVTLVDRGEPGAATSRGNAAGIAWTDVAPARLARYLAQGSRLAA